MTSKNQHGGKRTPGPGKKLGPPKKAERYRHRNITLPPATDDLLKEWSIAVDNDTKSLEGISALINRLVLDFFANDQSPTASNTPSQM